VFINWQARELGLKIVYYGVALCGKTTNLQAIYARIDPRLRGDLVALKTREDRTIFFDFVQVEFGEIKGLKPKFNLYTVPGQVIYVASRRLVLQGADGAVFVVDTQAHRLMENIYAWIDLQANLSGLGHNPGTFPIVIQYNKRDLPNALPIETLRSKMGLGRRTQIEAVASQGIGVLETLKQAIRAVANHSLERL
jgi:signal recognition particle receptor subunit beta